MRMSFWLSLILAKASMQSFKDMFDEPIKRQTTDSAATAAARAAITASFPGLGSLSCAHHAPAMSLPETMYFSSSEIAMSTVNHWLRTSASSGAVSIARDTFAALPA